VGGISSRGVLITTLHNCTITVLYIKLTVSQSIDQKIYDAFACKNGSHNQV